MARETRIDMPGHQRPHISEYKKRNHDATTRLGDGSAREPTKVVTSCDKSRGEA